MKRSRHSVHRSKSAALGVVLAALTLVSPAAAAVLPAPSVTVSLPGPAANAFGVSVTFGPSDGLMYIWDGAAVLKQDGFNSASFTSIGAVGSGSADAGPIAFSRDGSTILVGNGAGGLLGGSHAGLLFDIPAAGGSNSTALTDIDFHNTLLAAPLGVSTTRYFVNQGANLFGTESTVSVFDASGPTHLDVIQNIPGASSSMALDAANNLYVGIGFGAQAGELRRFSQASLAGAFDTSTPLDWSAGTLFNSLANNSGAGMFFDARGYLFAGGPDGVAVFDPLGNAMLYDNGGYTTVVYDPANDRLLVSGFGNYQGMYAASAFLVPEPGSLGLMICGTVAIILYTRRRRSN